MRSAHALGPVSHAGRLEQRQTGPTPALLACASCVAVLTRALAVSRLPVNPKLGHAAQAGSACVACASCVTKSRPTDSNESRSHEAYQLSPALLAEHAQHRILHALACADCVACNCFAHAASTKHLEICARAQTSW